MLQWNWLISPAGSFASCERKTLGLLLWMLMLPKCAQQRGAFGNVHYVQRWVNRQAGPTNTCWEETDLKQRSPVTHKGCQSLLGNVHCFPQTSVAASAGQEVLQGGQGLPCVSTPVLEGGLQEQVSHLQKRVGEAFWNSIGDEVDFWTKIRTSSDL